MSSIDIDMSNNIQSNEIDPKGKKLLFHQFYRIKSNAAFTNRKSNIQSLVKFRLVNKFDD